MAWERAVGPRLYRNQTSHEWPRDLDTQHLPDQGHQLLALRDDEGHDRQHRRENQNVV